MSPVDTVKRFRILIIDDNPAIHDDIRKILPGSTETDRAFSDAKSRILGQLAPTRHLVNFEIDSAFQGEEGFQKVLEADRSGRPYALAFVDVRMPPGWDGIETIERLWETSPDLQIVLCTAYSDHSWAEIVRRLVKTDCIVILKKPFDNIEVLQLAHALTSKWQLGRDMRNHLDELDRLVNERTIELSDANEQLKKEITERSIIQEALRKSEERFSKAFIACPVPMAIQSIQNKRFVDVNDSFLELTGFNRAELIGHSAEELGIWNIEDPEELDEAHALQPTAAHNQPFQMATKKHGERDIVISSGTFELEGSLFHLLLVRDVTDQKRLEAQLRQLQKMEAVGQLAAGVAHDFNNILQVIQGFTSVLLYRNQLDLSQQEPLQRITDATERAARLVQQLMTFSRKAYFKKEPVDLRDSLAAMSGMLPRLLPETIETSITVAPNLPLIHADMGMVDQALVNLALNARDAMPEGGLLTIRADEAEHRGHSEPDAKETSPKRFVCLSVADTGCGMSPEVQARLFEPFFTTKPVGKGTGLGLASVYGIAEEHGGWVQSQPGVGSEFRLFLPACTEAGKPDATSVSPHSNHAGHETILVVEDEEALREYLLTILNEHGYRTFEAASGPEALQIWAKHRGEIQLLLTDMVMPGGLTGRQLAEQLLLEDPSLKVIFSSGYSLGAADQDLAVMKENNFIAKPYTTFKLLTLVRETLEGVRPGVSG
jgi:two-component system, cell cycle sensor histidine kinase and response regulator CckA